MAAMSTTMEVEIAEVREKRSRRIVAHLVIREAVEAYTWSHDPTITKTEREARHAYIEPIVRHVAKLDMVSREEYERSLKPSGEHEPWEVTTDEDAQG